jgi:elongator complex protein 3
MAPTISTTTIASTHGKSGKKGALAPEGERFMQACADIAHQLIQDHEENDGSKVTNLNSLRGQVSKKHKLSTIPPLTAIMAAIPEHYKKYINWKLVQKPVRMLCVLICASPRFLCFNYQVQVLVLLL